MLRRIDRRLVRLAFPLRSRALQTLADTDEERLLIAAALHNANDGARAYVQRPFLLTCASRFSDGSYGVLYAANSLVTAARESAYHLARTYADGKAPAMETRRVHLTLRIVAKADDIRRRVDPKVPENVYDPHDYTASQSYGASARERAQAISFDSVRNRHGGTCVGAFTPRIVKSAHVAGETALLWDGTRYTEQHLVQRI